MTPITQTDLIESIAAALQYISFYHPVDYITNLARAYSLEQSHPAKDAIAQILINSRMCAEGHRPICQDTGIVTIFLKVGLDVRITAENDAPATLSLQQICDEGVRRAWLDPDNKLRGSILRDPAFSRKNTIDNTPCVVEVALVPGNTIDVTVAAKGGGSEAKSKFVMLNPSDSIIDWVLKTIPTMGAGWCPPGMLGIGIGGTAEKAMLLAKQSLMDPIDMQELKARGASTNIEQLRMDLYDRINALGIGAQGLGGLTTVLDVKILDWPTHAANLPVAMIPNCAATRHAHSSSRATAPSTSRPPTSRTGPPSPTTSPPHATSTSPPSPAPTSKPGSPAKSSSSPENSSPAATPRTSACPTCSTAASTSPSTSPTASSTTSAPSTPSATKPSAPPAPPPPPAWTSSPARCSKKPAYSA